jgi:TRAP-type C4-dicarboxylate transport system substrate-binding protein
MLALLVVGLVACGEGETVVTTAGSSTTAGTATSAAPATTAAPVTTGVSAPSTTAAPAEVFKLTWATGLQSVSPMYKDFLVSWGKWMEQKSDGRLVFDFKPDGAILPPPEILDGVANGVADMGDLFMGLYAGRFPLNEVLMLPLMFDYPAARAAGLTATDLAAKYPQLTEEFTKANVKFLGYMPMGPGQIHTTSKQVKTAADLKGMVLESHSGEYVAEALKILGATPEQINPAEGFDALAKGIVQGTVGEFEFIVSAGFNQVIKYSTEVGTFGNGFEAVVMNLDAWNKLPADLQELLLGDGMKAYMEVCGYMMDKGDKAARDVLDKQYKDAGTGGVYVLPDAEREAWRAAIAPVWDMWVGKAAAAGVPAEEMLAEAQNLATKYAFGYSAEYPESIMKEWGLSQ